MDAVVESLVLDLLEWLARGDRAYEEVMDAWRTSCPKLPVWEEANDSGFVECRVREGRTVVAITEAGRECLRSTGRHLHHSGDCGDAVLLD